MHHHSQVEVTTTHISLLLPHYKHRAVSLLGVQPRSFPEYQNDHFNFRQGDQLARKHQWDKLSMCYVGLGVM